MFPSMDPRVITYTVVYDHILQREITRNVTNGHYLCLPQGRDMSPEFWSGIHKRGFPRIPPPESTDRPAEIDTDQDAAEDKTTKSRISQVYPDIPYDLTLTVL